MGVITSEEARAYLARWELVRKAETAALKGTSMETKLRQLSALMASRHLFGNNADREKDARTVRERWERLRRALGD
jgi:hypothetical protein